MDKNKPPSLRLVGGTDIEKRVPKKRPSSVARKRKTSKEETKPSKSAFAEKWIDENEILVFEKILRTNPAEQFHFPKTEREWGVACAAAAFVVEWLNTNAGRNFLKRTSKKGGENFVYEFPVSKKVMAI